MCARHSCRLFLLQSYQLRRIFCCLPINQHISIHFLHLDAWNGDISCKNASSHLGLRFINRPTHRPTVLAFTYLKMINSRIFQLFCSLNIHLVLCCVIHQRSEQQPFAFLWLATRCYLQNGNLCFDYKLYALYFGKFCPKCKMARANFRPMKIHRSRKKEKREKLELSFMGSFYHLIQRYGENERLWKLSLHSINAAIYHQRFYFNAIHLINFGIVHFEYYTHFVARARWYK